MSTQAQTVLVVEDEVSIASFVSLYLKNAGYLVRTVGPGAARDPDQAAQARRPRDRRRPPRGSRLREGGAARAEGVRPSLGAARPPRARAHSRPTARARLGLHLRGRHPYSRRARSAVAA